jgi:hypothetical protein
MTDGLRHIDQLIVESDSPIQTATEYLNVDQFLSTFLLSQKSGVVQLIMSRYLPGDLVVFRFFPTQQYPTFSVHTDHPTATEKVASSCPLFTNARSKDER